MLPPRHPSVVEIDGGMACGQLPGSPAPSLDPELVVGGEAADASSPGSEAWAGGITRERKNADIPPGAAFW
jgi:hypothetical protein